MLQSTSFPFLSRGEEFESRLRKRQEASKSASCAAPAARSFCHHPRPVASAKWTATRGCLPLALVAVRGHWAAKRMPEPWFLRKVDSNILIKGVPKPENLGPWIPAWGSHFCDPGHGALA